MKPGDAFIQLTTLIIFLYRRYRDRRHGELKKSAGRIGGMNVF